MALTTTRRILASVVLLAAIASSVRAQSFEIGPMFGVYLPVGSFQDPAYFTTALPEDPSELSALSLGGQARLRLSGHLGVQFQANLAASKVGGGPTPGGSFPAVSARVFLATIQGTYYLTTPARHTQVWLSAGPALVRFGGEAYAPYGHPVQFAGSGGLSASLPVARRVRGELGVSLTVYYLSIRDPQGAALERGTQVDSRLHAGLSWVWP